MSNWQTFLQEGKLKESKFSELLVEQLGGTVTEADQQTDMKDHIDVFWEPNVQNGYQNRSRKYGIDVKGLKKSSRYSDIDENIHWIELQNVNGDPGWVRGKADYIAFELNDFWLLITPKKILELIQKRVKNTTITHRNEDFYTLYNRRGRQDVIVKVKSLDLMAIANKILWKQ